MHAREPFIDPRTQKQILRELPAAFRSPGKEFQKREITQPSSESSINVFLLVFQELS